MTLLPRFAPAENLCYVYGSFIGRFCDQSPSRRRRGYFDMCWREDKLPYNVLPGTWPSTWQDALDNGLDASRTGTDIFTSNVLNKARIPTVQGSSREIHNDCPEPFLCRQMLDRQDNDAHIMCVRDTEHIGYAPDRWHYYVPRAAGGNLRLDLHDVDETYKSIDHDHPRHRRGDSDEASSSSGTTSTASKELSTVLSTVLVGRGPGGGPLSLS